MKIVTGDLWEQLGKVDILLVTTNSTLNNKGALVMGRGAAKEAADNFPNLPYELGREIKDRGLEGDIYDVILIPMTRISAVYPRMMLGAFQVKTDWRSYASLSLILRSTAHLTVLAKTFPFYSIAMNYPGIGNGKLEEKRVLPIIERLPRNVTVYKKS